MRGGAEGYFGGSRDFSQQCGEWNRRSLGCLLRLLLLLQVMLLFMWWRWLMVLLMLHVLMRLVLLVLVLLQLVLLHLHLLWVLLLMLLWRVLRMHGGCATNGRRISQATDSKIS